MRTGISHDATDPSETDEACLVSSREQFVKTEDARYQGSASERCNPL
jgi:hypothetical protein